MSWLVVGGAGYIGSHVVRRLRADRRRVVVLDDLSSGRRERVPYGVPLVVASSADRDAVCRALDRHRVTGVVNLAARKSAPESVEHPLGYYRENVESMRVLLEAMVDKGVRRMLFSSSAAVYGRPPSARVDEETPSEPINPYGQTKLICEWMLRSAGAAHDLSWIALRYFNVVGAADPVCGEKNGANLFPLVFRRVTAGLPAVVTGQDFPTRDGTGVRDYVHVADVADAHAAAVGRLEAASCADVYNVGTGDGYSVLEVLDAVREVTGLPVDVEVLPARPGDPPEVVAEVDKIRRDLGWKARNGLVDMVRSTWQAYRRMRPAR
ncbi:UDP-glucose 4-epimerase GalE [Actinomycetes bacterium KLBMP 9797]